MVAKSIAKHLVFIHNPTDYVVLKQRKIDGERRVFRDKLTDQYCIKAQKKKFLCV